jgi:amino-acid N-acetyltransferase
MTSARQAVVGDAKAIHSIIRRYALEHDLVIRTLADIYAQIRDYTVIESKGALRGVIALHVYWEDLAEVRSFVVDEKFRGKGFGIKLIKAALIEAGQVGVTKVFALTKIPKFFKKYGFKKISKKELPHKIWKDCFNCSKFPDCDEEALILNLGKTK